VKESSETAEDTTGKRRAHGIPPQEPPLAGTGSVRVLFSAAELSFTENLRRLILHASNAEARPSDAKADRERSEREDRGGGWEWWEREAATGGDHREPVKRDCGAGRSGAVGGEVSPSVGWRETAERMSASAGCSHR
jgi:hypothetical protein